MARAVGRGRPRRRRRGEALRRIEALDGPINAVCALRADEALAEAADLDRRLDAGQLPGPLAGVPLLVKDLQDVAGMPTRAGSTLLADAPPKERDGLVVARLRAAGAIVVGKSTLPEFATEGHMREPADGRHAQPLAPAELARAARRAAPPPLWRPAWCRSRRGRTAAGRCGSRPRSAGWSG